MNDVLIWFGFLLYIGLIVNMTQILIGDERLSYWKAIRKYSFYVELPPINLEQMTPWRRFLEIEKLRIRERLGR